VLFLLGWCGTALSGDDRVVAMVERGGGFETGDRDALVAIGREFISGIVPLYRELSASGQVELSASPFNHPLMPLVHSNSSALDADPSVVLPEVRFNGPLELERQIVEGLDFFSDVMGTRPAGMWPPEGAVSEPVVEALKSHGIRWIASDDEILRRSLGGKAARADRLAHYSFSDTSMFFRDRVLSDHIGFVYCRWPNRKSVEHFMGVLRACAEDAADESAIVVVALDGENAWEFYQDGGYPFLDAMYSAVEDANFAESVTFSQHIERFGAGRPLERLSTGSWINGDLDTWIGDPVKNKAWEYLAAAFQTARDAPGILRAPIDDSSGPTAIRRSLQRAEASDWFWWFGRGHESVHEMEFDYLFRQNLRMVYKEMGLVTPDYLSRPVSEAESGINVRQPSAYISPAVNGRDDSFYKWVGAGSCEFSHGSIHRLKPVISSVHFGFDRDTLYFRVAWFEDMIQSLSGDAWMKVHFALPSESEVCVRAGNGGYVLERIAGNEVSDVVEGGRVAIRDVLEMSLPVSVLNESAEGKTPFAIGFCIVLGDGDLELERFPWDSVIAFEFDPESLEVDNWFV